MSDILQLYLLFTLHSSVCLSYVTGIQWHHYKGQCYSILTSSSDTFNSSKTECQSLGAFLVELDTEDEMEFIRTIIPGTNNEYWVGLEYASGTTEHYWIHGGTQPITALWADGEPNQTGACVRLTNRLIVNGTVYTLGDNPCDKNYSAICEKQADILIPVTYSKTTISLQYYCPIETLNTTSKVHCATKCSQTMDCIGLQYNEQINGCSLFKYDLQCSGNPNCEIMYKISEDRCS